MTDATAGLSTLKPTPYDVLVVGSDAAALVAALDCARIGLRVVVFATRVSAHRPTVFSHRGGTVASLLTELEIEYFIDETGSGSGSVAEGNIVGIPANPFAKNVREHLGWRGAWRVYLDRITPLLTIGAETNLGTLVRRRMGAAAVTSLVDPALLALYGRTADETSTAAVVPGLNQAMTRAGSLTTGVIELIVADPRIAQTLHVEGGTTRIETALRERLEFFSARIIDVTDVHLELLEPTSTGTKIPASFIAAALLRPVAEEGEAEAISVVAHAVLMNPLEASAPEHVPEDLVTEVGISSRLPGLESAVPISRAASASIRRALLSNPNRLPMGPLDCEG